MSRGQAGAACRRENADHPSEGGKALANNDSFLTYSDPRLLTKSVRASAMVFEDPLSRALLDRIRRIAPSEANVLIIGETGTGKEIVARHVHELSARREGRFVAVNCGSLPETLVEAELFGHEKGAFTGAVNAKEGWFEAAHGGTLFLDEIGDLPLAMQVKLLRVLQEREVVRVGSRTSRPINVRLIAATNVHLERAVASGRFREDLFYRLRVASLECPPCGSGRAISSPLPPSSCASIASGSAMRMPSSRRKRSGLWCSIIGPAISESWKTPFIMLC